MMKTTFEDLYEKYHQDLFQYIFYLVKDKTQAEDLIQEVYIKVLSAYSGFNGDSAEKTWLFSIARHTTFDYFRKLKRKRMKIQDFFNWEEDGEKLTSTMQEPEDSIIHNDEMHQVYHCLDQCTVDQKQVVILRYIQEFSIKETAEILKWSTSKVKTTQHRALKVLQSCMMTSSDKEDVNHE
ncbi:RNA polymerase sigma factor SigX [Gracilibacillus salinarum]